MKENTLKRKLKNGERVIGTFFHSGSQLIMDAVALSGMDYVIIDKEHSPIAIETATRMIVAAEARKITPLVRIKEISRSSVLKLLDVGAKGLIVPQVHGIDDIQTLVEFAKYPPTGNRGMAMGRGVDYGLGARPITKHWEYVNEETLLIPMCETKECLDDIERIAAVDGVDGVFIGPCDLSIALEKPGEFEDEKVTAAFMRVVKACKDAGKFCLIYSPSDEYSKKFIRMGFDGLACGIDVNVCLSAYLKLVKNTKEALTG